MNDKAISSPTTRNKLKISWRKWLRIGFIIWAVLSTGLVINSFSTRDVDPILLTSSPSTRVANVDDALMFLPEIAKNTGLIFITGGGVEALAYAPMLRPIADNGYAVFIIKLPYRLAPLESHKRQVLERVQRIIQQQSKISHWVLSGHSLGAALACRFTHANSKLLSAMVLIGTTHPKQDDLSALSLPVTKVYGALDGIAPVDKINANKPLLPAHTNWVLIDGANHSQFGHYGTQLFDGKATISRELQQATTRDLLLDALINVEK